MVNLYLLEIRESLKALIETILCVNYIAFK